MALQGPFVVVADSPAVDVVAALRAEGAFPIIETGWADAAAAPNASLVTRTQALLNKLGYDVGARDGQMGEKTRQQRRDEKLSAAEREKQEYSDLVDDVIDNQSLAFGGVPWASLSHSSIKRRHV